MDQANKDEMFEILADLERCIDRLDGRLQAVITKLLAMRGEVEDRRTCQIILHLGRRGDVKAEWRKRD